MHGSPLLYVYLAILIVHLISYFVSKKKVPLLFFFLFNVTLFTQCFIRGRYYVFKIMSYAAWNDCIDVFYLIQIMLFVLIFSVMVREEPELELYYHLYRKGEHEKIDAEMNRLNGVWNLDEDDSEHFLYAMKKSWWYIKYTWAFSALWANKSFAFGFAFTGVTWTYLIYFLFK